jgi:hypothetical protein
MEYRWSVGDIPEDMSLYSGVVAVEDCSRIGDVAWINIDDRWRRVIAFDCLNRTEYNWMQAKNIIAELGFYLARKADIEVGRGVKGFFIWEKETNHVEKETSQQKVQDQLRVRNEPERNHMRDLQRVYPQRQEILFRLPLQPGV